MFVDFQVDFQADFLVDLLGMAGLDGIAAVDFDFENFALPN